MPRSSAARWGLLVLPFVLLAGLVLERAGILDWHAGVMIARVYADRWWLAPALAAVTALLFAASLPGSAMVWILGILFPPVVATPAFVAGGVAGAYAAYLAARAASGAGEGEPDRLRRLLAERGDFATLLAVRVVPSFPHSAINLAAGVLAIPRQRFLISTSLGLLVKGALYLSAIHQASGAESMAGAISWRTVAPLVVLAVLLVVGPALLRRRRRRVHLQG